MSEQKDGGGIGYVIAVVLVTLLFSQRCTDDWKRCESVCAPHRVSVASKDACECDMRWERR